MPRPGPLPEKRCCDCGEIKPRAAYRPRKAGGVAIRSYCRPCDDRRRDAGRARSRAKQAEARETAGLAEAGLPPPVRLPTAAVAPQDILDAALTVPVRKKIIKTAITLALGEGGQKPDRALLSYLMERVFGPVKSAQPPGDGDDLVGIAAEISAIALATRRERGHSSGADDPLETGGLPADPEPVGLPSGDTALGPDRAAE